MELHTAWFGLELVASLLASDHGEFAHLPRWKQHLVNKLKAATVSGNFRLVLAQAHSVLLLATGPFTFDVADVILRCCLPSHFHLLAVRLHFCTGMILLEYVLRTVPSSFILLVVANFNPFLGDYVSRPRPVVAVRIDSNWRHACLL
jgi:hypothetical protein